MVITRKEIAKLVSEGFVKRCKSVAQAEESLEIANGSLKYFIDFVKNEGYFEEYINE